MNCKNNRCRSKEQVLVTNAFKNGEDLGSKPLPQIGAIRTAYTGALAKYSV
jgi:hypothetical protein